MHSAAAERTDSLDKSLTDDVIDLVLRGMWRGVPEARYRPWSTPGSPW